MSDFRFVSAADLHRAYESRRKTPTEVIDRALAAAATLDRNDPPMRTFIALDSQDVRKQAEESTGRWHAGNPLGPLDGVPIAMKDEYAVRGYGTTCGTRFLGKKKEEQDALTVARLRAAGAVIFGKTNMHELGVAPSGLNLNHGTARNPYDPGKDTGGSSSGSGAAVAAGIVPIAMGNDGGGSIRIPAAICGVAGMKGTYGRVPMDGIPILNWSLEHAGPLGATVGDVVTAFSVCTDETMKLELPAKKLRVGVCEDWWKLGHNDVAATAHAAIKRLVEAGIAEEVAIELPHIELVMPVGIATFGVEGAVSVERYLVEDKPLMTTTRLSFDMARGISATTFVKAQRARTLIVRDFQQAFANVDVIVTPTTAATAHPYRDDQLVHGVMDQGAIEQMVAFTFALNLTGMPAMTVTCGYDPGGMPVGLQIIGPMGADELTFAVAAEVEKRTQLKKPRIWHDLLA